MKKFLLILTMLSCVHSTYAQMTYPLSTTQTEKIRSDAIPQGMSQAQYQALLLHPTQPSTQKVALSAIELDFRNRVLRAWQPPLNTQGESAMARIILTESGSVSSITVQATHPKVKISVEQAVRAAAPFPMPSDPELRKFSRTFTVMFTVK